MLTEIKTIKRKITTEGFMALFLLFVQIVMLQTYLFNLNYVNKIHVLVTSLGYVALITIFFVEHRGKYLLSVVGFVLLWIYIGIVQKIYKNPFIFYTDIFIIVQFVNSICLIQLYKIRKAVLDNLSYLKSIEKINFWLPFVFLLVTNTYFVIFNYFTPQWDQARHAYNVLKVYHIIKGEYTGWIEAFFFYDFYPSVVYLVGSIFVFLFGESYHTMTLSMPLFWFPIAYFFMYKIVREYFRMSVTQSSLVTFTLMGGVFISGMTKQLLLELPVVTTLIVFVYYLFKSNFLAYKKYAFVAGMVFGIGMLCKENFMLFAFIPLVACMLRLGYKVMCKKRLSLFIQYVESVLYYFAGLVLIAGMWYMCWADHYIFEMNGHRALAPSEGDPDPFSLASFIWYPLALPSMFTIPVLVILTFGLVKSLSVRKFVYVKWTCFVSIVFILGVTTIQWNKDVRYIIGVLVFLFPLYVGVFCNIRRYALISNVVIVFFVAWIYFNNISHVFKVELPIPFYSKNGYVVPDAPLPPSTPNTPESFAAFVNIYDKAFSNNPNQKLLIKEDFKNFHSDEFNEINWKFYRSLLHVENRIALYDTSKHSNVEFVEGIKIGDNSIWIPKDSTSEDKLIFYRDEYYPNYYLFKTKIDSGNLYIEKAGFNGKITGDIIVELLVKYKDEAKIEKYNLKDFIKIHLPENYEELKFNMSIFHSHGRPQMILTNLLVNPYPMKDLDHICKLIPLSGVSDQNANVILSKGDF